MCQASRGSEGNSPVSLSQRPRWVDLRLNPRPWPLTSLLPHQRETPRDLPLLHPLAVVVYPHGGVRHMKCQSQIAGSGSELKTLPQRVCTEGSSDSAGANSWYWVSVSRCILPPTAIFTSHTLENAELPKHWPGHPYTRIKVGEARTFLQCWHWEVGLAMQDYTLCPTPMMCSSCIQRTTRLNLN